MYEVGLVLEGGGMRGIFTTGVLDFFLEKNIDFKEVVGVSAGACHACSFVSKQIGRSKAVSIDYIDDKRYCSIYSLIKTGNLFGVEFIYDEIPHKLNLFDNETFKNSDTKLFAGVTNIVSGEPEYMHIKDMNKDMDVLIASASLPLVSKIIKLNNNKYLDGGISDSVPIKMMQERGFLKNVVVLTQPKGYIKEKMGGARIMKRKYKHYPNFIKQLQNRHIKYNETIEYIESEEDKGNIFVIRPKEKLGIGRVEKDKEKLEQVYKLGYECAKEQYEQLVEFCSK